MIQTKKNVPDLFKMQNNFKEIIERAKKKHQNANEKERCVKKATKKTINVRHLELELEKRNKICDGTAATVKANKHTYTHTNQAKCIPK